MQVIPFSQVNETIYYEQLTNGLKVYILPKEGFQKTYATFSTQYGSIDNWFCVDKGSSVKVPDGIAHFLEHKMFEEPTGDIFATFASLGASANAFTSFDRTAYLFSATGNIEQSLETLINFVQNPYFTDENVEKEKGIIGQEIRMYQDNPDWRSYFGLIEAMYKVHPIHIDIAGTIDSIAQISKETLYECYHTFYHPSNMSLFVVGGIDPEAIMELVKQNQANKSFVSQGSIERLFDQEPLAVGEARKIIKLPVALPKCLFGCKEPAHELTGLELLKHELATKLMLEILLGGSSTLYQSLYDDNLISDGFGHEYNISEQYAFTVIGGDTKDPEQLISRIQAAIDQAKGEGIAADDFERSRRRRIGGFLRQLNSPEAIANEFTKYKFKGIDLFDILPVYEAMTLEDVNERLRAHFDWNQMACSIVRSEA